MTETSKIQKAKSRFHAYLRSVQRDLAAIFTYALPATVAIAAVAATVLISAGALR